MIVRNKCLVAQIIIYLLFILLQIRFNDIAEQMRNRISGVMVNVLASSVVDRGFEPRSGQTTDYKIGICCNSAKHTALRSKSKDWLAQSQNNVSEWSDVSTRGLLFQ